MANNTGSLARAQGHQHIPWPAGIVEEPDNCCVALRVRTATERPDGSLSVALDRPRVACGPALPTLLDLIAYRFGDTTEHVQEKLLKCEVRALGWIDPRCPLRLERVLDLGKQWLIIEALILPFGEQQAAELDALMRTEPDPPRREERAWEYAKQLEQRWLQGAPGGQLPVRHLDVDFSTPDMPGADHAGNQYETAMSGLPPLPADL